MTAPGKERRTFLGMSKSVFVAGLVLYLIASSTFFTVFTIRRDGDTRELAAQGQQAVATLCSLRDNLARNIQDEQAQLDRSRGFFAKNSDALPGVPRAVIRQGQDAQAASILRQRGNLRAIDRQLSC